jgi:hypothetical protein
MGTFVVHWNARYCTHPNAIDAMDATAAMESFNMDALPPLCDSVLAALGASAADVADVADAADVADVADAADVLRHLCTLVKADSVASVWAQWGALGTQVVMLVRDNVRARMPFTLGLCDAVGLALTAARVHVDYFSKELTARPAPLVTESLCAAVSLGVVHAAQSAVQYCVDNRAAEAFVVPEDWRQQLSSAFETMTDKAASAQECAVQLMCQALDRAGHRNVLAELAAEPVPNDFVAALNVFMSRLPQGVADREVRIIRILHATCNDAWFFVRAFMPPSPSPLPQLEVA